MKLNILRAKARPCQPSAPAKEPEFALPITFPELDRAFGKDGPGLSELRAIRILRDREVFLGGGDELLHHA